jgi:hypothetical protein
MHPALTRLKSFISSPFTQFATGLILLISGCATAYYEFVEADHTLRIGVHHGVVIWAVVQVLGSLPDLIVGIDRSIEAMEKRRRA